MIGSDFLEISVDQQKERIHYPAGSFQSEQASSAASKIPTNTTLDQIRKKKEKHEKKKTSLVI